MTSKYNAVMKLFNDLDSKDPKWRIILDDIFWPINMWPRHLALNLYNCEYNDRISIISFLYKNTFPPHYAFDMIKFYAKPSRNRTPWRIRETELKSVWKKCEEITLNGNQLDREKYFYYSMYDKAVFNYAGHRKLYGRTITSTVNSHAPRSVVTEDSPNDLKKKLDEDVEFEILADEIASKIEEKNDLYELLNRDAELESAAVECAMDAEDKYEQEVLKEILAEI